MDLQAVPCKTDLGRETLADRSRSISRAQRALLIMADGTKSLKALSPALASLGLTGSDLAYLSQSGLLAWRDANVPTPSTAARPSQGGSAAGSVAAAKLFALELAGRMLGSKDQALREAARRVTSPSLFMPWLETCIATIKSSAGAESAAVFERSVLRLLPASVEAGRVASPEQEAHSRTSELDVPLPL